VSLYRKYRPKNFKTLVGQDHIKNTLRGAIKSGRVSHAYLFAGPRGTGKTTVARILAKAVNCLEPREGEPCGVCAPCLDFSENRAIDMIEIDAASNRGIDEVRDIREKIKITPASMRFKVYIIDEVHMLTREAFNALLKTIEEPPEHALFILATTELHKIPATIISRCQRFDFNKIGGEAIKLRLKEICGLEKIKISDEGLEIIIRYADGSLRDAISILDQLASDKKEIEEKKIKDLLGITSEQAAEEFLNHLAKKKSKEALETIKKVNQSGGNLVWFLKQILSNLQKAITIKINHLEPKKEQFDLQKLSLEELIKLLKTFSSVESLIKKSELPELPLEIAVLELIEPIEEGSNQETREISLSNEEQADRPEKHSSSNEKVNIKKRWAEFIADLKTTNLPAYTFLSQSSIISFDDCSIHLAFPNKFYLEMFQAPKNRSEIEGEFSRIIGKNYKITGEVAKEKINVNPNHILAMLGGEFLND